ncbi:tyrosinase [Aspergillus indologenus CBS 114.80]|uniref:Tyrosinase n=1 Tax=Aspergillus indologenus CBS 114.80 TaxID=1450541 RepID=A0A2V5IGT7_9EURO|nr:tyrosinase [Aspergillus indologenus CBS 114.80]
MRHYFILSLLALATASQPPRPGPTVDSNLYGGDCTRERLQTRKEWRNLDRSQQEAYLDAVQCLIDLPAETGMAYTTSRWSDLQALHRYYTNTEYGDVIHNVGQFLPWHRYLLHIHETLLREQCGYTGPMVWWNEQADADTGDLFRSPMWNDDSFGGDGTEPANCVADGRFADLTQYIGPFDNNTERCLEREWDSPLGVRNVNSTMVGQCFDLTSYTPFWQCVASYPHKGVHQAVGGLMADVKASPGDPMFYIHHAFIDRLWYTWQMVDPDTRLFAMGGTSVNYTDLPTPAGGWPETTLEYELESYEILPGVTVEDVMNPVGGYLCYEYD